MDFKNIVLNKYVSFYCLYFGPRLSLVTIARTHIYTLRYNYKHNATVIHQKMIDFDRIKSVELIQVLIKLM